MNIIVFVGTRPELIKLYPVILELKKNKKYTIEVCFTGQHDTLLKKIMNDFNIVPNYNLKSKNLKLNLNILSSNLYKNLDKVFNKKKFDLAIVQGDTTSALVAAMAAFHRGVKVAHVEAGLRTGNLSEPFPEEANRILISKIADINFAPTTTAKLNLIKEGVKKKKIFLVGNTIVDAIEIFKKKKKIVKLFSNPYVFITCHRRENHKKFEILIKSILQLAKKKPKMNFVFLTHPGILKFQKNLNCLKVVKKYKNIKFYSDFSYFENLSVVANAYFIISDSGGIQEEAPSFGKYVFIIRNYTERNESIKLKLSELIKINEATLLKSYSKFEDRIINRRFIKKNPYGDGTASKKIYKILKSI